MYELFFVLFFLREQSQAQMNMKINNLVWGKQSERQRSPPLPAFLSNHKLHLNQGCLIKGN